MGTRDGLERFVSLVLSTVNARRAPRNGARDRALALLGVLAVIAAVLCAPRDAHALAGGWDGSHTVALGMRGVGRFGQYHLGGVGGQLRWRPFSWMAVDLFADHTFGSAGGFRHDHEIGGTLQFPSLIHGERWSLYPFIGACAMLVVLHPEPVGDAPAVWDVRFGAHGGAGFEYYVHPRVSLQVHGEAIVYVGHDVQGYRWGGNVSQELYPFVVGQATLGANYWF